MQAYSDVYLNDVVENQGKLFDFVAQSFPDKDTVDFINAYMQRKTKKSIDEAKAYVNIPSAEIVKKIPVDFLKKAYFGLHDLELSLAVQKVGEV